MRRTTGARRYAQAIFEIARERDALPTWQVDLERIVTGTKEPELAALLDSTKIPFEDKKRFISERLVSIDPLATNLLYLLVLKGRVALLDQILVEFQRLADEERGIAQAEVTSAVALKDEEEGLIAKHLAQLTGTRISLQTRVDPAIIGGLVVRVGDRIIDGSTRNKLSVLKEELTRTTS